MDCSAAAAADAIMDGISTNLDGIGDAIAYAALALHKQANDLESAVSDGRDNNGDDDDTAIVPDAPALTVTAPPPPPSTFKPAKTRRGTRYREASIETATTQDDGDSCDTDTVMDAQCVDNQCNYKGRGACPLGCDDAFMNEYVYTEDPVFEGLRCNEEFSDPDPTITERAPLFEDPAKDDFSSWKLLPHGLDDSPHPPRPPHFRLDAREEGNPGHCGVTCYPSGVSPLHLPPPMLNLYESKLAHQLKQRHSTITASSTDLDEDAVARVVRRSRLINDGHIVSVSEMKSIITSGDGSTGKNPVIMLLTSELNKSLATIDTLQQDFDHLEDSFKSSTRASAHARKQLQHLNKQLKENAETVARLTYDDEQLWRVFKSTVTANDMRQRSMQSQIDAAEDRHKEEIQLLKDQHTAAFADFKIRANKGYEEALRIHKENSRAELEKARAELNKKHDEAYSLKRKGNELSRELFQEKKHRAQCEQEALEIDQALGSLEEKLSVSEVASSNLRKEIKELKRALELVEQPCVVKL